MTEKQIVKLGKVDDKIAYENLLVKYADLENKIADIKANCDFAIEGRDVKIMELEKENAELKKRLVFARAEFQRQYKENAELKEEEKDAWQKYYDFGRREIKK